MREREKEKRWLNNESGREREKEKRWLKNEGERERKTLVKK